MHPRVHRRAGGRGVDPATIAATSATVPPVRARWRLSMRTPAFGRFTRSSTASAWGRSRTDMKAMNSRLHPMPCGAARSHSSPKRSANWSSSTPRDTTRRLRAPTVAAASIIASPWSPAGVTKIGSMSSAISPVSSRRRRTSPRHRVVPRRRRRTRSRTRPTPQQRTLRRSRPARSPGTPRQRARAIDRWSPCRQPRRRPVRCSGATTRGAGTGVRQAARMVGGPVVCTVPSG